jgi:hypothetical protein
MLHSHHLLIVAVAVLASAAQADTIYVDDDNCPISDCCFPHVPPGCDDPECEEIVCTAFPQCCKFDSWFPDCADLAILLCPSCQLSPGSGTQADPYCSIQVAINAARDGDEIIVSPGAYIEQLDLLGKAIRLRSSGGPDVTMINRLFSRAVRCESGEGSGTVLDGFTIAGGGMLNRDSSPIVTNCLFTDSFATQGGGMYNDNSSPIVTNCTFTDTGAIEGGGMYNMYSSPTVMNCTFTANNAAPGNGGGMYNEYSSPVVTNCTFSGNQASQGGGMYNENSNPTVIGCMFTSNSAIGTIIGGPPPTLPRGGGMYNDNSSPTITNCTFSGNTATDPVLPGLGGGMFNWVNSNPSVTNCILWDNSPNEIDYLATVSYSNVCGGWPGTGNIDADPMFVDPFFLDFRLSPGSPCIDAGDNTAVPEGIDTDLDGNPRFVDDPDTVDSGYGDPPIVDMGAYEYQIPCPWDLNGDGNVDVVDLLMVIASWGPCADCPADLNNDGLVNVVDLLALIANFGPCSGAPCVWDVTGDGVVDQSDLQQVLDSTGSCDGCPEDVNGDGFVNGQDAAAVAKHFGPCP